MIILIALVLILGSEPISRIFNEDLDVIALSVSIMPILAISNVADG